MERWHEDVGCMHGNCISMRLGQFCFASSNKDRNSNPLKFNMDTTEIDIFERICQFKHLRFRCLC